MTENNQNSEKNLQLSYSQLANYVAGAIILSFFIFVSGYYWGKKSSVEFFNQKIENDSLEDKIYSAFCSLNDTAKAHDTQNSQSSEHDSREHDSSGQEEIAQVSQDTNDIQENVKKLYFAQLANFVSLKSANSFAQKLMAKGFDVKVVQSAINSDNKKINWYQVVTQSEENKENLDFKVLQIKKIVKLNNVKILTKD